MSMTVDEAMKIADSISEKPHSNDMLGAASGVLAAEVRRLRSELDNSKVSVSRFSNFESYSDAGDYFKGK